MEFILQWILMLLAAIALAAYLRKKMGFVIGLIILSFCVVPVTCSNCMVDPRLFMIIGSFISMVWISLWFGNEYISHILSDKFPWTSHPVKRLLFVLMAVCIYSPAVLWVLIELYKRIFDIGLGNTYTIMTSSVIITVIITLFMTGRAFLFNWRQVAIDAGKFRAQSIAANYESLKNQVNPHFLFNSLNALTNLVYEDQDKAAKFIKQLSEVYRYVLDTRDKEIVSLEEELKFLQSYVYLQQIRFGDKLRVDIKLSGTKSMVAPLALQMLIENAIKHNIISQENPLSVKIYSSKNSIIVENDLQRRNTIEEGSSGVGLENIKKRYEFLSGKTVEIEELDTIFRVTLPVINPI